MRYYLVPYTVADILEARSADPDDLHQTGVLGNHLPDGTIGAIDLRSIPDQGDLDGRGVAFVATNANLDATGWLAGTNLSDGLTGAQRATWAWMTGAVGGISAGTVIEALAENLTTAADPTGAEAIPPIAATVPLAELELHLAGHSKIWSAAGVRPGHALWPVVRDRLRSDYALVALETADGRRKADTHRRWLGAKLDALGIARADWRELVPVRGGPGDPQRGRGPVRGPGRQDPPAPSPGRCGPRGQPRRTGRRINDMPIEPPLDPQTSYSDAFTYGTTDLDGQGYWEDYPDPIATHKFTVVSDEVQRATGSGSPYRMAQWTQDLSSDDHYSQIRCVLTNDGGPATRVYEDGQVDGYFWEARRWATPRFAKLVNSTWSNIANLSMGKQNGSDGDLLRITSNGTGHSFRNETDDVDHTADTTTDASFSGQTRAGFASRTVCASCKLDDWSAADLAAAGAPWAYARRNASRR